MLRARLAAKSAQNNVENWLITSATFIYKSNDYAKNWPKLLISCDLGQHWNNVVKDLDATDGSGGAPTGDDVEAATAAENSSALISMGEKPRRKPGRPRGSRNRNTQITRAVVNGKDGIAALRLQVRVAAGLPVKRPLAKGGYETVYPEWSDVLATGRELMKYQLPALKATEIDQTVRHEDDGAPQHEPRQVARAILATLAEAVPGRGITVEQPGVHTARFRNADLARTIFPDTDDGDLASEMVNGSGDSALGQPDEGAGDGALPSSPADDPPAEIGDVVHAARGSYAEYVRGTGGPPQWLAVDPSGCIVGRFAAQADAMKALEGLPRSVPRQRLPDEGAVPRPKVFTRRERD